MKTMLAKLTALASVALALTITGCSNVTEPATTGVTLEQELSAMMTNTSATISDDGIACQDFDPMNGDYYRFDGPSEMRGGKHGKGGHHGKGGKRDSLHIGKGHKGKADSLMMIIKCLNLTDDQKLNAKPILDTLRSQVHVILKALRDEQKPLRDDARTQAKAVFDQLKAGTITRDEAKTQLDAIRTALNTALEPGRTAAHAQIKDLRVAAVAQLRGLLTPEQQAILDAWVQSGIIPC
ncbi:MAG: Spy/CpxP family protein refolding chaperone [Candidatus Kapabacteria bacterium]|nr:Spy/CpxP family protein refolding chaperone [Candidatus Kapabacteria bacterium]